MGGDFINIGIDNAAAKWINSTIYNKKHQASYTYYGWNGFLYLWDDNESKINLPIWKKPGDILTMKLEFTTNGGILSFAVNDGIEFGKINVTIKKGLNYRMAVSLYTESAVQIIE